MFDVDEYEKSGIYVRMMMFENRQT
jgi:hypothetical protein